MAGYSNTPLVKKLGFTDDFRVRVTNAPGNYTSLLEPLPAGVKISRTIRKNIDAWHLFTRSEAELRGYIHPMRQAIEPDGMIWVSWPKKSSGESTDVTENVIRSVALPLGLVDVKVCAVDHVWSGLKLVIRKALRSTGG